MRTVALWYIDDTYTRKLPDGRWVYKFFRVDGGQVTHTYYCYDELNTGPDQDNETFSRTFWNADLPDVAIPISECWARIFASQLQWLETHDFPLLVDFTITTVDDEVGKK